MLRVLTWESEEKFSRLTPQEVDALFAFTFEVSKMESNSKYIGGSEPIYWERTCRVLNN